MPRDANDMVRVAFHPGYYDGLAGLLFRDGVSENRVPRWRAEQLVTLLGDPARVLEDEPEAPKRRKKV